MPKRTSDDQIKVALGPTSAKSAIAARRQKRETDEQRQKESLTSTETPIASTVARQSMPEFNSGNNSEPGPRSSDNERSVAEAPVTDENWYEIYRFKPTGANYHREDEGVKASLRRGEALVFQGEYRVRVLSGSIKVCGARLKKTQEACIYAPSTHSFPAIEPCIPSDESSVNANGQEFDAIILICNSHSGLVDIGRVCPTFKNIWNSTRADRLSTDTFTPIWQLSSQTSILDISPWTRVIEAISENHNDRRHSLSSPASHVVMVSGSKAVGKSTFCRVLSNTLMTGFKYDVEREFKAVAFLDIDPGQPTFTPSCMVSLQLLHKPILGPPFTCVGGDAIMQRQHHVGFTSPKEDSTYYISCVLDLLDWYHNNLAENGIPLIINTPGWTRGLGRELLQQIIQDSSSNISDVVALGLPDDVNGFLKEVLPHDTCTIRTHIINAVPVSPPTQRFPAPDLRMLQTICYFHSVSYPKNGAKYEECRKFDFKTHISSQTPWIGSWSSAKSAGVAAVTVLDTDIPEDLLLTVLPGTIVSIDAVHRENFEHPVNILLSSLQTGKMNKYNLPLLRPPNGAFESSTEALLRPSDTSTIGLAIIRNIDFASKEIHFLTPITAEDLYKWDSEGYQFVFVRGRVEMPVWLLWEHDEEHRAKRESVFNGKIPYLNFERRDNGKGARQWKVRRNLVRREQVGYKSLAKSQ